MVDAIAIGTGLNYYILQHRASPIRREEEIEWRTVWQNVTVAANELLTSQRSSR
jgi:hypothetical protein